MTILGLNAYHGDSSACIIRDGELIAAVEEERFTRIKHWAGYPRLAVDFCLREAGIHIADVSHIAVNRNPKANIFRKAAHTFLRRPSFEVVKDRLRNAVKIGRLEEDMAKHFGIPESEFRVPIHRVEHHVAHAASAFYVSPFTDAAVLSTDGFGDFVGALWGEGHGTDIRIDRRVYFPHSLGLFYLTMTQYCGFPRYGDEYKVMGLASYGTPDYLGQMREIVRLTEQGGFELALEFFNHATSGISMTWANGHPEIGKAFTDELERFLGPARKPDEPIERRHENMASSMQAMYEEAFFHMVNHLQESTGQTSLALAGGTAMNSVANGKIFHRSAFTDVFIQSAAGDAGGAIGAAYHVWNAVLKQPRGFVMEHSYWGPRYSMDDIRVALRNRETELAGLHILAREVDSLEQLCDETAAHIAEGSIVGWFQGRAEWGPRALGNRSIVVDPRRADMKDILNARIKRREAFRPFAPSILEEYTGEYFEIDYPDPFMIKVYPVRKDKHEVIPAVTHVDGSGRLQTVSGRTNPRYWQLIESFRRRTGVPVVLNTSFNENEPIVCTPDEALDTFLRTRMDVLVMEDVILTRGT